MSDDEERKDQIKPDPNANAADRMQYVNAVTNRVPIPKLNDDQVETWFLQLDHWFDINQISEKLKFGTVVASLEPRVVNQVHNAIKNPPATKQYENLKQAVLAAYAESSQQRFQKLVSGIQLGDRRPSHLLNELRRVSDTADEKLLKNFWLSRLPVQVKTIVSASSGELSDLSRVADAVMDSLNLNINQASVEPGIQPNLQTSNNFASLQLQIQELSQQVQQLTVQRAPQYFNRSRSRGRYVHQQPVETSVNKQTTCRFHRKFGVSAYKCIKPCNFLQTQSPKLDATSS